MLCQSFIQQNMVTYILSPVKEANREVANLTERKNPHTPGYGVKEFVCLSVAKFDPNYLRIGKTEWAEMNGPLYRPTFELQTTSILLLFRPPFS